MPTLTDDAVAYFDSHRSLSELMMFRNLCNGFKAGLIAHSVAELRRPLNGQTPPSRRFVVLDVGSGRGGDLAKWARHRPRLYIGVDAAKEAVDEARARHSKLISDGRGGLDARFIEVDIRHQSLPAEDASVDIVSIQFALQFAFDTEASASHLISEITRVLRPGGILVGMFPDGDRLASLFKFGQNNCPARFGHFLFYPLPGTQTALVTRSLTPPVGIPYKFVLGSQREACPEYLVSSIYLDSLLKKSGLEGVGEGVPLTVGAQTYFTDVASSPVRDVILAMAKLHHCTSLDWVTMGAFRVLLARRACCQSESAPSTEASQ